MNAWLIAANVVGWPIIHMLVSWTFTALPARVFDPGSAWFAPRRWEIRGTFYREVLGIKGWKARLPDAAAWFAGGFPKRKLQRRDAQYRQEFAVETCRGEAAHWVTLGCAPVFFIWNPPWACAVMVVYAVAANIPCVVVQRYNRAALTRIRIRGERRS